eukprot:3886384-Amphidinium_carterae.1
MQQGMSVQKQTGATMSAAAASTSRSPIDTRYIGKPDMFNGTSGWKDWCVVMRSYASAISLILAFMNKAETTEEVVDNLHLSSIESIVSLIVGDDMSRAGSYSCCERWTVRRTM